MTPKIGPTAAQVSGNDGALGEIRDSVSHGDEKLIEVMCMSVMGRNKLFGGMAGLT